MTTRVLHGDCRDVLPTLPDASVHMVCTSPPYFALRSYLPADHPDKHREIGSEATADEWIATMVAVFREVRRVLRPDGTCWVNIGDSYVTQPAGNKTLSAPFNGGAYRSNIGANTAKAAGLKPKDLLLMPARLALALQADGWWVRSDIIWAKPNPMPESCTDRPTSAHEHVFLLTKSTRYFYDIDATREPLAAKTFTTFGCEHRPQGNDDLGNVKSDNWGGSLKERKPKLNGNGEIAGANLRNVWTIATEAFPGVHYATFPTALVERCIRAGTSERGCCAECGAPWVRQGDKQLVDFWHRNKQPTKAALDVAAQDAGDQASRRARDGHVSGHAVQFTTTGWAPSCPHADAGVVPCTVLDPFMGSGTTALVADRLQRDAIGIELSEPYTAMAEARVVDDAPLFAWGAAMAEVAA